MVIIKQESCIFFDFFKYNKNEFRFWFKNDICDLSSVLELNINKNDSTLTNVLLYCCIGFFNFQWQMLKFVIFLLFLCWMLWPVLISIELWPKLEKFLQLQQLMHYFVTWIVLMFHLLTVSLFLYQTPSNNKKVLDTDTLGY